MMLRLRSLNAPLRRALHGGIVNRDQLMEQLQVCSAEDQVFDVVGKNKAKLTVNHVSQAVGMLWNFQTTRPEILRNVELIKSNPQFTTLRVLAENKIAHMDDSMLVDSLYSFLRLNVEPHDSLVQQLVSEAWRRIDRLSMASLSKFAICIDNQHLRHSPLMGHITSIVDQRLSSIDDFRILSAFMISLWPLVSPRLRDALINRADHLLDTVDITDYNSPRRVVQFLRNTRHSHWPLLEKCHKILMWNIPRLDVTNINIILLIYQSLHFYNWDFTQAVKQRLIELVDSSTDPISFTYLFVTLAPMASQEIRERLENTALLLADEFNALQAMVVAEALAEIQSRNLGLLKKIASVVQRNLHLYMPLEVARTTKALIMCQYQNHELFTKLRNTLVNFLQHSVCPHEVTKFTRVLSMLPSPRLDDRLISRVDAVLTQSDLYELNIISFAVIKWMHDDTAYCYNTPNKYVRLLQNLNRCGHERLQKAYRLDLLLGELKNISGEWFEEMLAEEILVTLQRMMDQINWTNIPELALLLSKISHLCPPLMDRIASVAMKDIDKIHHSSMNAILLPFSLLNYHPAQADEFYDACIQRIIPHISYFEPHTLVFLAHTLAMADCFPEELVRQIFSIEFLGMLDAQLETLPEAINMRTRIRLMQLNRAACLECPEFQVPWFHERFCRLLRKKGTSSASRARQQIHKMMGEVLDGINCVRSSVVTPYFYTIDFECILDKHLQPLPYSESSTQQISDRDNVHWGTSSLENIREELPPGAQRVAVDFLNPKNFFKNSHRMKGESLMKKRHLEILGYRLVQIPHFEWNSMELSTQEAWKEYLKKKIFKELSS